MRVVLFTSSICGQPGLKRAAGTAPPLHCETHMHTGLNHLAIKSIQCLKKKEKKKAILILHF